jgi:hypothetical protein
MFCRSLFVFLFFFLLAIVLSVFLQFTDSDYPFGIFKRLLTICIYIYISTNGEVGRIYIFLYVGRHFLNHYISITVYFFLGVGGELFFFLGKQ